MPEAVEIRAVAQFRLLFTPRASLAQLSNRTNPAARAPHPQMDDARHRDRSRRCDRGDRAAPGPGLQRAGAEQHCFMGAGNV